MSTPKRIQRQRTQGWRMPEGAVYVGRPTLWGNPFAIEQVKGWPRWAGSAPWHVVAKDGRTWEPDDDRRPIMGRAAADRHRRHLAARKAVDLYREALRIFEPDEEFWTAIEGRDLACWCPLDQPCHADVLLEIANPTPGGAS
jgi:hypothetical protein